MKNVIKKDNKNALLRYIYNAKMVLKMKKQRENLKTGVFGFKSIKRMSFIKS